MCDDFSLIDHGDVISQPVCFLQILRRQQNCRALIDQPKDYVPQTQPAARVKAGGWLIKKQDLRIDDQRRGEVDAPAHSTGESFDRPVLCFRELEKVNKFFSANP